MISPLCSVLSSAIYSFSLALSNKILLIDFLILLLVFLIKINILKKAFFKTIMKLLSFISIIALSIILIHKDYELAKLIFLRSFCLISFNLIIFYNINSISIYKTFLILKMPKKFCLEVFYFIKSLYILKEEYKKIKNALKIRGFKAKTNIFSYKTIAYCLSTLLIKSYYKMSNFIDSLKLRSFNNEIELRTFEYFNKESIIFSFFISSYFIYKVYNYELFFKS